MITSLDQFNDNMCAVRLQLNKDAVPSIYPQCLTPLTTHTDISTPASGSGSEMSGLTSTTLQTAAQICTLVSEQDNVPASNERDVRKREPFRVGLDEIAM